MTLVGEAVLTVVACLTVLGLALASVRGWGRSPLVTGGVGGAVLVFLGHGGRELLRPTRPGRRGPRGVDRLCRQPQRPLAAADRFQPVQPMRSGRRQLRSTRRHGLPPLHPNSLALIAS